MRITIPRQEFEVYPKDLEGQFNYEEAKEACEALGDGWRLPTREELTDMYKYKEDLELKDFYWSSSEYNTTYAFYFTFSNGTANYFNKSNTLSVRAVRTIKKTYTMIIEDADFEDDYIEIIPYKFSGRIEINISNDNILNLIEISKQKAIQLRDELTRLIKQMEDAK